MDVSTSSSTREATGPDDFELRHSLKSIPDEIYDSVVFRTYEEIDRFRLFLATVMARNAYKTTWGMVMTLGYATS